MLSEYEARCVLIASDISDEKFCQRAVRETMSELRLAKAGQLFKVSFGRMGCPFSDLAAITATERHSVSEEVQLKFAIVRARPVDI
jgi:hypothetical protein